MSGNSTHYNNSRSKMSTYVSRYQILNEFHCIGYSSMSTLDLRPETLII